MDAAHPEPDPQPGLTRGDDGHDLAPDQAPAQAEAQADERGDARPGPAIEDAAFGTDQPLPAYLAEALAAAADACAELLQVRPAALSGSQARALLAATTALTARAYAAHLHAITVVDDHPDAVPKARPRQGAAFLLRHALHASPGEAARDTAAAHVLAADTGDLPQVGQALREGRIGRDAALVAADVHRRLSPAVRDRRNDDGQRLITVLDGTLAEHAQRLTHTELRRAGDAIVALFDEPTPRGAHDRRYLHLSPLRDGTLKGRFACGPAQAALLQAAISAGAAPRPGLAIDPDGVQHTLRDDRSTGQRQMDALADLVAAALSNAGLPLPDSASPTPDREPWFPDTRTDSEPDRDKRYEQDERDEHEEHEAEPVDREDRSGGTDEPPASEGEEQIIRPAGVLTGPYPPVEILLVTTVTDLAAALDAGGDADGSTPERDRLDLTRGLTAQIAQTKDRADHSEARDPSSWPRPPGWARADHPGHTTPVAPATLALLACSAGLRRVLTDPTGAVLDLGRARRYATPAQRKALTVRDGGCLIPGCPAPATDCDIHHITAWAEGGPTDLTNLVLLCSRHHTETHDGTWTIQVNGGLPWIRPPRWLHHDQPLLRNTLHGGRCGG